MHVCPLCLGVIIDGSCNVCAWSDGSVVLRVGRYDPDTGNIYVADCDMICMTRVQNSGTETSFCNCMVRFLQNGVSPFYKIWCDRVSK